MSESLSVCVCVSGFKPIRVERKTGGCFDAAAAALRCELFSVFVFFLRLRVAVGSGRGFFLLVHLLFFASLF